MADTKQGVLMARERNMRKDWRQIRTAGGPRPQRSRKDEGVGDSREVLARATRCDRGPVAVRYFALANSRATAGSWRGPFRFAHALGLNLSGSWHQYGVPPSGGPDRLKPGHQTGGP